MAFKKLPCISYKINLMKIYGLAKFFRIFIYYIFLNIRKIYSSIIWYSNLFFYLSEKIPIVTFYHSDKIPPPGRKYYFRSWLQNANVVFSARVWWKIVYTTWGWRGQPQRTCFQLEPSALTIYNLYLQFTLAVDWLTLCLPYYLFIYLTRKITMQFTM